MFPKTNVHNNNVFKINQQSLVKQVLNNMITSTTIITTQFLLKKKKKFRLKCIFKFQLQF